MSFNDKVVVITGASGGIGAALAHELHTRGSRLVLAARRGTELNAVALACGDALAHMTDVTSREEVNSLVAAALNKFGRIDIWVNNVGRALTMDVANLDDESLDTMFTINVKSALYGMQAVLPHMLDRGDGVIANVSSMLGRVPWATRVAPYCAAKAALNSLTEALRLDLQQSHPGIRVVSVVPGPVATDFGANAIGESYDSHSIPGVQPVEDVARIIADGLYSGPVDIYTPDKGHQRVMEYMRSLGE